MSSTLRFLLCLACVPALCTAQLPSGFEDPTQAPGALLVPGVADVEGWVSIGGPQMYMPDGVNQVGSCGLPIDGSTGWCEISPYLVGPASPIVPPSTPGTYPFVVGSVSEMRMATTVPIFTSLQTALTLDWYFMSAEGQDGSAGSGGGFDDFAQVLVVDPSTNGVIAVALYVDTYAPAYTAAPNTCLSGIDPGVGTPPVPVAPGFQYGGTGQTATVQIPSQYFGAPVIISVVSANQSDNQFASTLFIDNVKWIDGASVLPPFSLTATTSGSGVGDLSFGTTIAPVAASHVNILISGTPALMGLGTGLAFGLVPDALLIATLLEPAVPLGLTHFPTGSDPYQAGLLNLPAGTLSVFSGQTWECVAVAYGPGGMVQLSNFASLTW